MQARAIQTMSLQAAMHAIFSQRKTTARRTKRRSSANVIKVGHLEHTEDEDPKSAGAVVNPANLNTASDDSSEFFAVEAAPSESSDSEPDRCCSCVRTEFTLESKRLGEGQSDVSVVAACHKRGGKRSAVKIVSHAKLNDLQRADLSREASIHLRLSHPHIVSLHKVFETAAETSLVMKLLEGGEVFQELEAGPLGERRAAALLRQTLLALQYLHDQGLVHRDLKPENLVFADAARSTLQLVDFGFAQHRDEIVGRRCGTEPYMAPEVYRKELHGTAADLWSLGIVAYVFLTGAQPWTSDEETNATLLAAGRPYYWPAQLNALSAGAQDFIKRLLVGDAASRLSASAALVHPWLQEMTEPACRKSQNVNILAESNHMTQEIPGNLSVRGSD